MTLDRLQLPGGSASPAPPTDLTRARWVRLAEDFARLPALSAAATGASPSAAALRDVGELLLRGHDQALAEAERYVVEGHTMRTGEVVEYDDIDDDEGLERWALELDRASAAGFAPPVPNAFWASFLRWRTPLGMARLTESRKNRISWV